jgi:hypothetical protein
MLFIEKIYKRSDKYNYLITFIIILSLIDQFRFPIKGWNPKATVNSGLESQAEQIKKNCDYFYFDAPGGWWYDQAVGMRFSQTYGVPTVNGNSGGWPSDYPYLDFAHDGDISGIVLWMDKIQNKVGCFSNGELPIFISNSEQPRVHFEGGFTQIEKAKDSAWQWSISNKAYIIIFSPEEKDLIIKFDAKSSNCNENSRLEIKNNNDNKVYLYELDSTKTSIEFSPKMASQKFNKLELIFKGPFCNVDNDPRNLYYQVSNLEFSTESNILLE